VRAFRIPCLQEALVRVSALKALPTDEEIAEAECSDAHLFFSKLRKDDEDRYNEMMRDRKTMWGDTPTAQPVGRCVHHLIVIIIKTMEEGSAGADNLELTDREVANWISRHMLTNAKSKSK